MLLHGDGGMGCVPLPAQILLLKCLPFCSRSLAKMLESSESLAEAAYRGFGLNMLLYSSVT